MRVIFLVLVVFLSACATTARFQKEMNKWVGRQSDDLVAQMGAPESLVRLDDGGRVLTYTFRGGAVLVGGVLVEKQCRMNFRVDSSGAISSFTFQGNACRS